MSGHITASTEIRPDLFKCKCGKGQAMGGKLFSKVIRLGLVTPFIFFFSFFSSFFLPAIPVLARWATSLPTRHTPRLIQKISVIVRAATRMCIASRADLSIPVYTSSSFQAAGN